MGLVSEIIHYPKKIANMINTPQKVINLRFQKYVSSLNNLQKFDKPQKPFKDKGIFNSPLFIINIILIQKVKHLYLSMFY